MDWKGAKMENKPHNDATHVGGHATIPRDVFERHLDGVLESYEQVKWLLKVLRDRADYLNDIPPATLRLSDRLSDELGERLYAMADLDLARD